ncbi:MAG TPA: ROK family protein [Candidatus Dormibacteraeota bacterium]|nr:ROK family protein [Candidatus Dormibacteraeota bacterium]
MTSRPPVGIDLGGTSTRAAVALAPGRLGTTARCPTPVGAGADAVLDACAACATEACEGAWPEAVAIGVPGPLDPSTGVVYDAPNLPGFAGLAVGELLSRRLGGCPVTVENDAKLAAFAEYTVGAGAGSDPFLFVTVSTGIGGGLVLGGELFHGLAGTAGEVGHSPTSIDGPSCSAGHVGCLEGVASGTGIGRRARHAVAGGEPSTLSALAMDAIDAVAVERAALAGDALAQRLFADAGRALGRELGGLVNLLSPEVVVIGGGLINAGELLFEPLRNALSEIAFRVPLGRTRIVPAALGTDAGLIGATAWALRRLAS